MDTTHVRAFGGDEETGPSPVDRRNLGTKYRLLVDRHGVPLVLRAVAMNRSVHGEILPAVVSFPTVRGRLGRPRMRLATLYAAAASDLAIRRAADEPQLHQFADDSSRSELPRMLRPDDCWRDLMSGIFERNLLAIGGCL